MKGSVRNCLPLLLLLLVACLGCPTDPSSYSLAVYLSGSGTVVLDPAGGVYEPGTAVSLTATAGAGWHFDHWEGGAGGTANPLVLTVKANTTVTAVFEPTYKLKVAAFGKGTVSLDPPGGTYAAGTAVTLTPEPGSSWTFSHWLGGLSGTSNPASLVVAGDTEVTAVFRSEDGLVMQLGYGQLRRMAASPDGEVVITGSADGVIRIWDMNTRDVTYSVYEHWPWPVNAIAFSPDGSQFLTSHLAGGAELWTTAEVASAGPAKVRRMVYGLPAAVAVRSAAFSPLGINGLFGLVDGQLIEVDLVEEEEVAEYGSHTSGIAAVAYSDDGSRLASASYDETARVFVSGIPVALRTFTHPADVYAIAFLPGGEDVLTGCEDGNVRICNVASGAMTVMVGHTDGVLALALSPDGAKALSGSMDKTAILWDMVSCAPIYTLTGHEFAIPSVCFAQGGDQIFTADRETVTQWDAATGAEMTTLFGHTRTVNSAEFSSDGTQAVTAGDRVARLYDAATGDLLQSFYGHVDTLKSVVISPDGARIATASFDETIRVWDPGTGDAVRIIDAAQPVHAVDFSPDGTEVVAGLRNDIARTWNIETGAVGITFTGHTGRVSAVEYSFDGAFIATGSHDFTVKLWNAASGACIHTFPAFGNYVTSVAFTADATRLLAGSFGGAVRVFDTVTGLAVWGLPVTPYLAVYDVAFSPDASLFLTGNTLLGHLWDADGLEVLGEFFHFGQVLAVDYAPDALSVLTGGEDGSTRIWRVD